MKVFVRVAAAIVAASMSAGVGAVDLEDGITGIPADRGLIVFSTSGTKVFSKGSFLNLGNQESKRLYIHAFYRLDPPKPDESDFSDELGEIHQIFLPPGEYVFVPQSRRMRDWYLPIYKFTVTAGKAIYVGNYWHGDKAYEVRDS